MRTLSLSLVLLGFQIALPCYAAQSTDGLIAQWHAANGHCRGGSGKETDAWCKVRDSLDGILELRNWCYAKEGQHGFEMEWHRCGPQSIRSNQYAGGKSEAWNWEGIWAADLSWCKNAHLLGEHDPTPIKITRSEFVGLENWCKVTNISPHDNQLLLDLDCNGEGEQYRDRQLLQLSGENLLISREDEQPITFYRCKEPIQP